MLHKIEPNKMLEIKRLFFGRIWTFQNNGDENNYSIQPVDSKYRVFYLTKCNVSNSIENVFIDLESGKCYPLDYNDAEDKRYFVYLGDIDSMDDIYPILKFPYYLSKEQALTINEEFNKSYIEEYDDRIINQDSINSAKINELKRKILEKM